VMNWLGGPVLAEKIMNKLKALLGYFTVGKA